MARWVLNECIRKIDEKILSIKWGCLENKSLNYGLTGKWLIKL